MSTTGSTQPSRPDIRSSPSASSENVRARNSGFSSRSAAPPPAAPQAGAANPLRFDARTIHFSVNAWVLVVVGLGMLPILPKHLAHTFASFHCWEQSSPQDTLYTVLMGGYLEEPCLWVETNNTTLNLLSSNAELALGFLLIISLFSWRRNFMQTFMYWNVSYLLHI
ncbi:hypothetical protein ZWY2020_009931 [Hordeum vulgare]|nr:hypothetical protein ZWY2020_009931 [Hordeum vulgare]